MSTAEHKQQLFRIYQYFNARDVDAVLNCMHASVDWPNSWEGGRVIGPDAVRNYWNRQWAEINPTVEPKEIELLSDGRLRVQVHQRVLDKGGHLLMDQTVFHVYTFEGGVISKMDIQEA